MSVRSRLVSYLVVLFAVVSVVCGLLFHRVMFDGRLDGNSALETANFVLQTVTTVGYGNWVPATWDLAHDGEARVRVAYAKGIPLVLMVSGTGLFVVLVGIVANAIWAHGQREQEALRASVGSAARQLRGPGPPEA